MTAIAMTTEERKVRMNFEVPETLFKRAQACLPWGMRANTVRVLLEVVVRAVETEGTMILGALLSGDYKIVYDPQTSVQKLNASTGKRTKK